MNGSESEEEEEPLYTDTQAPARLVGTPLFLLILTGNLQPFDDNGS